VAEQLGNEKLTTLTNLNFDSFPIETFNGFLVSPLFTALACHLVRLFRLQDSGGYYLVVSLRDLLCPTLLTLLNAQRFLKFAALLASGLEGR
jgi:hypothetical protein